MGHFQTNFLTSTPSFLSGASTVFNLAGRHFAYNQSKTPEEADSRAIRNDWRMIGKDLHECAKKVVTATNDGRPGKARN